MLKKNYSSIGFAVILLCSAFILLFLADYSSFLIWDEPVYLGNARSHIATSHFTEDFRFPLLEYVIAFVWSITGESVTVAKTVMILFSLVSIVGFYLVSQQFFKQKWIHLISTLMFSLSPLIFTWGFRIYTDIPSLAMLLFSMYFLLQGSCCKQSLYANGLMFISGIFISLSFLFRFSTIIAFIPFALYVLFKQRFQSFMCLASGSLAALIPWLISNVMMYGNPIWDVLAQGATISSYTTFQSPMILLRFLFQEFSIGLILLLFALVSLAWKHPQRKYMILMWSSFAMVLLFHLFIVRLKLSRYILMVLPFVLLLEMKGLETINDFLKKIFFNKLFRQVLLIAIISVVLVYYGLSIASSADALSNKVECENNASLKEAIKYVNVTLDPGDRIISNSPPWFGYYGNLKAYSFWMSPKELFAEHLDDYSFLFPILKLLDPQKIIITNNQSYFISTDDLEYYGDEFISFEKSFTDACGMETVIYDVNLSVID
ncbi:MAG: ArnT family glycosyltransferase [Nanoarchaeota archaeon]